MTVSYVTSAYVVFCVVDTGVKWTARGRSSLDTAGSVRNSARSTPNQRQYNASITNASNARGCDRQAAPTIKVISGQGQSFKVKVVTKWVHKCIPWWHSWQGGQSREESLFLLPSLFGAAYVITLGRMRANCVWFTLICLFFADFVYRINCLFLEISRAEVQTIYYK